MEKPTLEDYVAGATVDGAPLRDIVDWVKKRALTTAGLKKKRGTKYRTCGKTDITTNRSARSPMIYRRYTPSFKPRGF